MQNQSSIKNENLVKISLKTNLRNIIIYVLHLLKKKEMDFVILSGLDQAIKRVIVVAEIIKVKIPNLHQINIIHHVVFKNKEGEAYIPKMDITLSRIEPAGKPYGYQPPYKLEQLKTIKVCKKKKDKNENKINKSFQLKRYSYYKKKSKIFLYQKKKHRSRRGTAHNSIDLKNSSSNTSIGTPISSKENVKKVFYLKI